MPSPPPTPPHATPREQAARLLAGAMATSDARAGTAAELSAEAMDARMESVERLFDRISNGLTRWLGPFGVHALMARALARVRSTYPALAGVTIAPASDMPDRSPTSLTGWHAAASQHGASAAMDGATAVLESLAEQMGRLIGDGLAATLLEQSAAVMDLPASVVYTGGVRGALGPPSPSATPTATEPDRQAETLPDVPPPGGNS